MSINILFILLFSSFQAEAISCNNFLIKSPLDGVDLAELYESGTPIFVRDNQIVAQVSLSKAGKVAYVRRGPIGPFTTLEIISSRNPQIMINTLDKLVKDGELNLFMNLIYKIYQIYMLPEKNFRSFMSSSYGKNTVFGRMDRNWNVLEQVLDRYFVIRALHLFLPLDSLDWVSPKSLERHYKKHVIEGQEFSFSDASEYYLAAKDFWNQNNFATITLSPSLGHFIRYNYVTYEFSVIRNGKITTYFRLTEDYRPENKFDTYIASDLLKVN